MKISSSHFKVYSIIGVSLNLVTKILISIRRRALKSYILLEKPGNDSISMVDITQILGEEPIIIEIGSHVGIDTENFAHVFPKGHIYSFEANPELYILAKERLQDYKNITLICAAVDNSIGIGKFHQSSGSSNGSGSLLKPTVHLERHPSVFFEVKNEFNVATINLDQCLISLQGTKIDLFWIDVQGAELRVLEGGIKLLANTRFVYTEVSKIPEYEGGVSYEELKLFMHQAGFTVEREFLPQKWLGSGNVLFKNNQLNNN
jgi:FkbM family methyltransferase